MRSVVLFLLSFLCICASVNADWVQVGSGEFNSGAPPQRHQSGRAWQTAFQFDNAQNQIILWVGTSHGGLWKAIVNLKGTITGFVPLTDNFPGNHTMGAFLVHPSDSNKILIGTGSPWTQQGDVFGIYRTTDQGATWTSTNTLPLNVKQVTKIIDDVADSSGDTVLAATDAGVWRSTDFGSTWEAKLLLKGSVTDLIQDPNRHEKFYAGVKNQGVFVLTKGSGTQWVSCPLYSSTDGLRFLLASSTSVDDYLFFLKVLSDGSMEGVFRTPDLDIVTCPGPPLNSWSTISDPTQNDDINHANQGWHAAAIASDPLSADHLIIGLQDLAETTNATATSVTWQNDVTSLNSGHPDQNHFLFRPSIGDVVIANDGGYYLYNPSIPATDDSGNLLGINALEMDFGHDQGGLATAFQDENEFLAGLQDNGMAVGHVGSDPEVLYIGGGDGGEVSISTKDPSKFAFSVTGGQSGRTFTSDAGANWTTINNNLIDGPTAHSKLPTVLVDPLPSDGGQFLYTYGQTSSTSRDKVFYIRGDCITCNWIPVSPKTLAKDTIITHIDHCMDDQKRTIIGSMKNDQQIFRYTGLPASMALKKKDPIALAGATNPDNPDTRVNADHSLFQLKTIYYTTGTGRPSSALVSYDAGNNWTNITGDLDTEGLDFIKLIGHPFSAGEFFLATNAGVFHTINNGVNWTDFSEGLRTNESVQDIVITNSLFPTLYIITTGRGFWKRELTGSAH